MDVAVLFARGDSIYKQMPGVDVYDIDRDALTFTGGMPIVAHPPCRAWGNLAHFAKLREGERELALWSVDQIRENGGVLEHPQGSRLWPEYGLPEFGQIDEWGGWTLHVLQFWWGHQALKATRLYIVGIKSRDLPPIPYAMGNAPRVVEDMSKKQREATPPALAKWLIEVARRIGAARMKKAD